MYARGILAYLGVWAGSVIFASILTGQIAWLWEGRGENPLFLPTQGGLLAGLFWTLLASPIWLFPCAIPFGLLNLFLALRYQHANRRDEFDSGTSIVVYSCLIGAALGLLQALILGTFMTNHYRQIATVPVQWIQVTLFWGLPLLFASVMGGWRIGRVVTNVHD